MPEHFPEYMQQPDQTLLTTDAILLTRYYSLGDTDRLEHEVSITDQTGERLLESDTAGMGFDLLNSLLDDFTPNNEYALDAVEDACMATSPGVDPYIRIGHLANVMPPEVFAINRSTNPATVKIGNIVLAGRKTTAEDIETESERYYTQQKAEIDKDKTTIIGQDHVKIAVTRENNTRGYILVLNDARAILATRCLLALQEIQAEQQFNKRRVIAAGTIIESAWKQMPTEERELVTKSRAAMLDEHYESVRHHVYAAMKMAGLLGIVHTQDDHAYKITAALDVTVSAEPPYDQAVLKDLIPVFPPGTSREVVQRARSGTLTPEALTAADFLLGQLGNRKLAPTQAIEVLNLIMDRDVKIALIQRLSQSDTGQTANQVIDLFQSRVEQALQTGYSSARLNRTIAGNHPTNKVHRARQVAGILPITTKLPEGSVKAWTLGERMKNN